MTMSVSQPVPVGPTVIGPVPWRDSTMAGIKDNNKVITRSDETVKFGRSVDPLPHIRFVYHEPDTTVVTGEMLVCGDAGFCILQV